MIRRRCSLRHCDIRSTCLRIQGCYTTGDNQGRRRTSTARSLHAHSFSRSEREGRANLKVDGWEQWSDINTWKPWSNDARRTLRKNRVDDENIIVDDLAATLKAHRTANRTASVRKLIVDRPSWVPRDHRSLDLHVDDSPLSREPESQKSEKPESEKRREPESQKRHRDQTPWPAQSNQHQDKHEKKSKKKKIKSYINGVLKPLNQWTLLDSKAGLKVQSPWLASVRSPISTTSSMLSSEIYAYESFMRLTPPEIAAAEAVKAEVDAIVKDAFPSASVQLMGSYPVGLAMPTSDLDFRLSLEEYEKDPLNRGPSPSRPKARKASIRALLDLRKVISRSNLFHSPTCVNGRIPIIKATHRQAHLSVDFQVSSTEVPTQLYKATYLSEFPTLRPLYCLLRSALEMRGLTVVFEGGLSSYSILIMIVYALKTCSASVSHGDIGTQLLHILALYANADLYKYGFSVNPAELFPKFSQNPPRPSGKVITDSHNLTLGSYRAIGKVKADQPFLLCLQDPADPLNDLGSKSYSIKMVQKLFSFTHAEIKQSMLHLNTDLEEREKIARQGLLFPLVGANYQWLKRERGVRIHHSQNQANTKCT